jgi:hypothetical protein
MLSFGPYRPDVAETNPAISRHILNVNPRKDSQGVSYHPRKSLQVTSGAMALAAAPRGGLAVVKRSGEFAGYFGTVDTLYEMDATYQFSSIGTGYAVPAGHSWGMCQYGDQLIVTNTADGMLAWDIESGGSVAAISGAPDARNAFVWAEMVIALDCNGDNRLMRNSAPGSYTNWTNRGAGAQEFADGEALMGGGVVNDGQAVVIQRAAVRLLTVTGTERIFRIDKFPGDVGAVSPECIVQIPGGVAFLDSSGPQIATAQGVTPIGDDKVARTFIASVGDITAVMGAYDPELKQVVWRKSATELLVYDLTTQEFVPVEEETSFIIRMSNPALTLEDLDSYGTIDTLPYSLDSNAWKGGRPRLAALDADYKFGFFDGPNLAAEMDTATLTDNASMLMSWLAPVSDDPGVTLTLGVRDRLADAVTYKDPVSQTASGRFPVRGRGKCIVVRINHAAGATWTYDRGIEIPPGGMTKGGAR